MIRKSWALGVARGAEEGEAVGWGVQVGGGDLRGAAVDAARGADEAEARPSATKAATGSRPGGEEGQVLDQQRQRDLEGVDPGPRRRSRRAAPGAPGRWSAPPRPAAGHRRLGRPQQVEPEVGLDQVEGQLDVPAAGVEAGDLGEGQHGGGRGRW